MEISTKVLGSTTHLLAFFPDITKDKIPDVHEVLDKIRNSRHNRMKKMVENAVNEGMDITFQEVMEEAKNEGSSSDVIGRPHLARVLVKKGFANNMDHAFNEWIAEGRPLHAERFTLDYKGWIELVSKNNGIVIWAHPLFYKDDKMDRLEESFNALQAAGIAGIEIEYPYNKRRAPLETEFVKEGVRFLKDQARSYDLIWTTGGDFHGDSGILGFGELGETNLERMESLLFE
jgi:predicted metal-dependent phosphoesterase TrpH